MLRRRRPQLDIDDVSLGVRTLSDDVEQRERLRDVLGDLQQLPFRQRSALVMRELGGLGYDEVAIALETTPGQVRRCARVLRRLRRRSSVTRLSRTSPHAAVRPPASSARARRAARTAWRAACARGRAGGRGGSTKAGAAKLELSLKDAAGNTKSYSRTVHIRTAE